MTWTSNIQGWAAHGAFEFSNKMQSIEIYAPVRNAKGEVTALNHETVFYDPEEPFQGKTNDVRAGVTLQPSGRFSQALNYRHVAFDRADNGERVYDLDIIYSRTTYQFSRQFFVRGIVQYDSSRYRVLTDFLASYELRPGTVAYVGYGSLIEQRTFEDGAWVPGRSARRVGAFSVAGFWARRRAATSFSSFATRFSSSSIPRTFFPRSSTRIRRSLNALSARVPPGRSPSRLIACSPLSASRPITSLSEVAFFVVAMGQSYHG